MSAALPSVPRNVRVTVPPPCDQVTFVPSTLPAIFPEPVSALQSPDRSFPVCVNAHVRLASWSATLM